MSRALTHILLDCFTDAPLQGNSELRLAGRQSRRPA